MKRRDFIIKTAASTAFLSLGGISLSSFDSKKTKRITIYIRTIHIHTSIRFLPQMQNILVRPELHVELRL